MDKAKREKLIQVLEQKTDRQLIKSYQNATKVKSEAETELKQIVKILGSRYEVDGFIMSVDNHDYWLEYKNEYSMYCKGLHAEWKAQMKHEIDNGETTLKNELALKSCESK